MTVVVDGVLDGAALAEAGVVAVAAPVAEGVVVTVVLVDDVHAAVLPTAANTAMAAIVVNRGRRLISIAPQIDVMESATLAGARERYPVEADSTLELQGLQDRPGPQKSVVA